MDKETKQAIKESVAEGTFDSFEKHTEEEKANAERNLQTARDTLAVLDQVLDETPMAEVYHEVRDVVMKDPDHFLMSLSLWSWLFAAIPSIQASTLMAMTILGKKANATPMSKEGEA